MARNKRVLSRSTEFCATYNGLIEYNFQIEYIKQIFFFNFSNFSFKPNFSVPISIRSFYNKIVYIRTFTNSELFVANVVNCVNDMRFICLIKKYSSSLFTHDLYSYFDIIDSCLILKKRFKKIKKIKKLRVAWYADHFILEHYNSLSFILAYVKALDKADIIILRKRLILKISINIWNYIVMICVFCLSLIV